MNGRTFKICGCRDETGRQLGSSCPRLRGRNHGSWAFMVDLAKDENGRRRQLKRSGFTTKAEAEAHLEDAVGNVRAGRKVDDKLTVGTWLDRWLDEKTGESGISAAGRPIRSATQVGYRQHVRDYLKPHLGHILLSKLSSEDISRAYRKIMAESAEKVAKAEAHHNALQPVNGKSGEAPKLSRTHGREWPARRRCDEFMHVCGHR